MKRLPSLLRRASVFSLVVTSLLGLTRCASNPAGEPKTVSTKAASKWAVAFVANRLTEIEPCGCSARPLGGVDREYNVMQTWKKADPSREIVPFTAGATFVPLFSRWDDGKKDLYISRDKFLLEALTGLGVKAVSPALADFALGTDTLRGFAKGSRIPFVSTNLYTKKDHKPVFDRYLKMSAGDTEVLVLGLSTNRAFGYPAISDVEAISPSDAVTDVLKEVGSKPRFIIVLSSLFESERDTLLKNHPEINLVLGGPDNQATLDAEQHEGTLYANPQPSAKMMVRVDLDLGGAKLGPFFNRKVANSVVASREDWMNELTNIDMAVRKKKMKAKEKKALEAKRDALTARLQETDRLSIDPPKDAVLFSSEAVYVDAVYAQPANALSQIIERYKATVHEEAMNESEPPAPHNN